MYLTSFLVKRSGGSGQNDSTEMFMPATALSKQLPKCAFATLSSTRVFATAVSSATRSKFVSMISESIRRRRRRAQFQSLVATLGRWATAHSICSLACPLVHTWDCQQATHGLVRTMYKAKGKEYSKTPDLPHYLMQKLCIMDEIPDFGNRVFRPHFTKKAYVF